MIRSKKFDLENMYYISIILNGQYMKLVKRLIEISQKTDIYR